MIPAEELEDSIIFSEPSDNESNIKIPDKKIMKVEPSSPKEKKKIHFRDYQNEIYENAKDKNGIIFLETGTGKTFISLMLSCYYLHKTNRTKKIAFLANTVQLVRQQYLVIRDMDDLHNQMKWDFEEYEGNKNKIIIKELYSQLDQEEYNRKEWFNKFYKNTNILVVTPQIFLNNLRRGYFSLKEYSMIVFDECHHTNEDHPYNNIMKEFYFEKKNSKKIEDRELPYIIGMTASPLLQMNSLNFDNIENSLIQICKNLDASFIKFDRKKLESFVETPKCKVIAYSEIIKKEGDHLASYESNLNINDIDNLFNKLHEKNQFIRTNFSFFNKKIIEKGSPRNEKLLSIINELQRFLSVLSLRILYELGYAAYINFFEDCLDLLLGKIDKNKKDQKKGGKNDTESKDKNEFNFHDPFDQDIFATIKAAMKEIEKKHNINRENDAEDRKSKLESYFYDNEQLSQKVLVFCETLEKQFNKFKKKNRENELQILIFVERRYVVFHLHNMIELYYKNKPEFFFKSGHILGFSKSDSYSKKFSDIENEIVGISTSLEEQEKDALDYYKTSDYRPQILPSCFQQSNKFSHMSVNPAEQLKTIEKFKEKKLNLLVTTSVAEEGFDMPNCNLVIAFNEIKSIQSFIQVRGRARKKDSKFLIMVPQHKKKEMKENVDLYLSAIEIMKDLASEIAEMKDIYAYEAKIIKLKRLPPKMFKEEFYKKIKIKHDTDENHESLLNTNWSKTVLSDYCNSLRRVIRARYESKGQTRELDAEMDVSNKPNLSISFRPIYVLHHTPAIGYLCHIIMPLNSNTRVFITRGDLMKTRADAKKFAAFELVKYLYRKEKAFYPDLRPNIRSLRDDEENDVEELIRNDEKKMKIEDQREKQKIHKLKYLKLKKDNLRFYYYLTNEIFNPNFLLTDNEIPRYYFYLIEFYDQYNKQIGQNANYQLGFLYFGQILRDEIAKGRVIEDHNQKIRMTIRFLTRAIEIPEGIFEQMKKIDSFLWSAINNDDLNFFNIETGQEVDQEGFYHDFIKKKHQKTKYIPFGFDFSKEYLMVVILNKKEPCLLAADKYREICKFIDEMSKHYKFYNALNRKIKKKEHFEKMSLNTEFVNKFKENPVKNEELIVQNITNFRKFQIKHFITMDEINIEKVTSIKSANETLKTRKKNLENNFDYRIKSNDYLIKVFGMTKCIENHLKTEILQEEAKYVIKEGDLNSNLSFVSEFLEFPLEFSFMVQLHFLNKPFMSYLRDFIKTVKFKGKLFKILKRKNPISQFIESNENRNETIQKQLGYELQIPENEIIKNIDSLEDYLSKKKLIVIKNPKFSNLKKFDRKENLKVLDESFLKEPLDFENLIKIFKIDLMLLRSALMSRKYNLSDNYERLEFFGDTILKALSTIQVFCENQNDMERVLHIERNKYVSNNFLCSKSCIQHFFKYVLNENFRFIPASFILKESQSILYNPKNHLHTIDNEVEEKKQEKEEKKNSLLEENKENEEKKRKEDIVIPENFSQMSNKSLADLIESLTAVIYESNNRDIAYCQYFLHSLHILNHPVYNLTIKDSIQMPIVSSELLSRYVKFQQIIGYKFNYPGLLIQAFTHVKFREIMEEVKIPEMKIVNKSKNNEDEDNDEIDISNKKNFDPKDLSKLEDLNKINAANFSYERLEFLGDAILDFFVNEYLFYETEVDSPGDLTLMKQSVVNNMSLSLIALNYDFDELILIGDEDFFGDPEEGESLHKIKKNWQDYYENIDKYYELKNESLKILGDLFEAFVGALFIDTGFSFEKTKMIIRNMIYEKFIKVFASEDYVNKLPEKKLKDILERSGIRGSRIERKEETVDEKGEHLFILYDQNDKEILSVYAKNMKNAENKFASVFTEKNK